MSVAAFCPPAGHNKYCIYLVNNTTAPYIFAQKIISEFGRWRFIRADISAGTSVRYRTSIVTGRWQPPRAKRHTLNLCIFLIRNHLNNGIKEEKRNFRMKSTWELLFNCPPRYLQKEFHLSEVGSSY